MLLGKLAYQKRQSDVGKVPEQTLVPKRCTFQTRRLIASTLSDTGVTKAHWKERNFRCVIKGQAIQLQPVSQTIAARIVPRYPTLVDFSPRGLADD